MFTGRELSDVFEEDFDDPDSLAGSGGVPDPLLAELGRARTGQIRDIVATIQGEQDAIIRAPLETCLVVQGGPGTGKTAVGLHRAAFLLYEHRARLARGGVLVVGPNPVFLRYISQVLPSLGETSATQTTVDGLLGLRFRDRRRRHRGGRGGEGRRAHGGGRRAGRGRRGPHSRRRHRAQLPGPPDPRELRPSSTRWSTAVRSRAVPVSAQRERFRRAIVHHAYDVYTRGVPLGFDEAGARRRAVRRRRVAQGDRRVLAVGRRGRARAVAAHPARACSRAADGAARRRTSRRCSCGRARPRPTWTAHDLPLLDEAEALLKGGTRQYEHVVVDEAQDLSPMQLRMLARRARRHSMTVLGDLAQATGPASPGSWEETLAHLGRPGQRGDRRSSRWATGFPGAVLSLANRLLARAAPGIAPSRSVRPDGDPPDLHRVDAGELVDQVADHAIALVGELATVAVIAMPERGRGVAGRARSARRACSPSRARSSPTGRSWSCPRRSPRASSSTA